MCCNWYQRSFEVSSYINLDLIQIWPIIYKHRTGSTLIFSNTWTETYLVRTSCQQIISIRFQTQGINIKICEIQRSKNSALKAKSSQANPVIKSRISWDQWKYFLIWCRDQRTRQGKQYAKISWPIDNTFFWLVDRLLLKVRVFQFLLECRQPPSSVDSPIMYQDIWFRLEFCNRVRFGFR